MVWVGCPAGRGASKGRSIRIDVFGDFLIVDVRLVHDRETGSVADRDRVVETSMANGASGVIAGRSLWKGCISLDRSVTKDRLETIALPRLREIQGVIARHFRG
jgi:hypothetical protein